jgi:hypothetical protein
MTDTDPSFGAAVTPPHRPQSLSVSAYGEETRPMYGEESHRAFGEGTVGTYGEGLGALLIEGETRPRSFPSTTGRRTSAFIIGEDGEE